MHALTLTAIERQSVLRHLRHEPTADDGAFLDSVEYKVQMGPAPILSRLELFAMLKHLREQRRRIAIDMSALEERRRGGYDGELDAAWLALDAEASILDGVLRRLWSIS